MSLALLLATVLANGAGAPTVVVCLHATILPNGQVEDITVVESSGSREADRYAVKLLHVLKLDREKGQVYEPQSGFVRVVMDANGGFGISLFQTRGRLLESCASPLEEPAGE